MRVPYFFLLAVVWPATAAAHVFDHPKVLRVGLQADRVLVSVTYDVNPGKDSLEARNLFDRNQDGALDEQEQAKLAQFLEESAMLFMKVKIDGQAVKLTRLQAQPNQLDRPVGSSETLGISLLYEAPLSAAAVALVIEDRDRDKQKHVPVVVDLAVGWQVDLSSQGELSTAARQIHRILLGPDQPLSLRAHRL